MKNDFIYPQPQQISGEICPVGGLTKLEYFAGLAMQGMLAANTTVDYNFAVFAAKHLIEELDYVQTNK